MNNKPWHADQSIPIEIARKLIHEQFSIQFPQFKEITIEFFGEGWDNIAFLINEEYVFRFPRRIVSQDLIMREAKLLPFLVDKLPLSIPFPKFIGQPTDLYPYPFSGYRKIIGTTACRAHLSHVERMATTIQLAQFLSNLHSIELKELEKYNLTTDSIGRMNISRILPKLLLNLDTIETLHLLDTKPLRRYLDRLPTFSITNILSLTHGDLYARHLVVNDDHILTGIIDWGDMELGHPAIDISVVHSFLPPEAHNLFKKDYGPISPETWALARFRSIYSLSNCLVYSHDIQDEDLKKEALMGFKYIYEELS